MRRVFWMMVLLASLTQVVHAETLEEERWRLFKKSYEYSPPPSNRFRSIECKRGQNTILVQIDYGYSQATETVTSSPTRLTYTYKADIPKREDVSYRIDNQGGFDLGQVKLDVVLPQMTFTPEGGSPTVAPCKFTSG